MKTRVLSFFAERPRLVTFLVSTVVLLSLSTVGLADPAGGGWGP
ncbi:MAG: hypothetical protein ACE5K4_07415 [Candidatus Hydrothermarchaeota archaeon]